MMTAFTPKIEDLLHRHLQDDTPAGDDHTLHTRSKGRGDLLRLPMENDTSIIVKIWQARNLKERVKGAVGLSNGRREWHMHRLLYRAGVPTPAPLWFHRFSLRGKKYETMAIEDLGETEKGLTYLKKRIAEGNEGEIASFDKRLIAITEQLLQLHILDIDHQLNNFVLDARGRLLRLDFECAKRHWFGLMPQAEYVEMISRLLASHIYAVQPETRRSEFFAKFLYKNLNLNKNYKLLINKNVNLKLSAQLGKQGASTSITLPV